MQEPNKGTLAEPTKSAALPVLDSGKYCYIKVTSPTGSVSYKLQHNGVDKINTFNLDHVTAMNFDANYLYVVSNGRLYRVDTSASSPTNNGTSLDYAEIPGTPLVGPLWFVRKYIYVLAATESGIPSKADIWAVDLTDFKGLVNRVAKDILIQPDNTMPCKVCVIVP